MRNRILPISFSVSLLAVCALVFGVTGAARPDSNNHSRSDSVANHAVSSVAYGNLPLSFEINQGQTDKQVRFLSRGAGYALFLTPTETVLALKEGHSHRSSKGPLLPAVSPPENSAETKAEVLRIRLQHANSNPEISGIDELAGKSNYFIGNNQAKWHRNVSTFGKVKYRQVYPGVDLVYYGNQRELEYDFVLAPNADPGQIELSFAGARQLRIDADGNLIVGLEGGQVVEHTPVVYQDIGGIRRRVVGTYELRSSNTVGFKVAAYDRHEPLTIDPTLGYSTYLGGTNDDGGQGIAVDSSGNAYVTGYTYSSDFPITAGELKTTFNNYNDAFVSKLNSDGSALVYSTYLGGTYYDYGYSIAVDSSGNAYVTGYTYSSDFPTTAGAAQSTLAGIQNAFVSKLNSSGSALVYSTYLGGDYVDVGQGIALDASGNAYVVGYTSSTLFPTTSGAFQTALNGSSNAFVSKLNGGGTALVYSTYLGGTDFDTGQGIAVDSSGNAYVTGYAQSSDFPVTTGALKTTLDGFSDAFVSKFNSTGSTLIYSTYLGGNDYDSGQGIALDSSGNTYITGYTYSTDFPFTVGAIQTTLAGTQNAFASKLNSSGSALVYSTYLGGNSFDQGQGIALDSSGNAYVTGYAFSSNFPVSADALQTSLGGSQNAFFSKLNSGGSALVYSTYLGGISYDQGQGIALDSTGNAFITGYTQSSNFPTSASARQTTFGGGSTDGFVTKIAFAAPSISFASFTGKLDVTVSKGSFDLNSSFSLGAANNGVNPITEKVTLQIGPYQVTIPPGSFGRNGKGPWVFDGVVSGASLQLNINATGSSYMLKASGSGAHLAGITNPVTVALSIGDDAGSTAISARIN